MRIKPDFIANSSTSVYIFYIPQDFEINLEDVEKTDYYRDLGDEEKTYIMDSMDEHLKRIKKYGTTDEYDSHWRHFAIFREVLEKKAHLIKDLDVGGGDGTYLVCVTAAELQKIEEKFHENVTEDSEQSCTFDPALIETG